jgi:Ca-activated chloride channel family protein
MTFLWRDALWLLLAVPVLIAAYVLALRRRKAAVRYPSLALLREAMAPVQRLRPHVPPFLFLLALVAILVAVSRPAAVTVVPSEQRTVVLAIDVSLSMGATDIEPSRLAGAQAAAKTFVRAQPPDVRVGIVAFAGHADLVQPPTTRRSDTLAAIDQLQLQYSTAIGNGVLAALMTIFPEADIGGNYDIFGLGRSPQAARGEAVRPAYAPPREKRAPVQPGSFSSAAIVLLTDGRSTFGIGHSKAAKIAADLGVRVYTVGFGSTAGATIDLEGKPVDAEFDEAALREIADTTRASYFHASTAEELNSIYRTLSGDIVLERKLLELTALFTALGALLSLSSAGLSFAWSNRLA